MNFLSPPEMLFTLTKTLNA